jgi:hypothetical protein
MVGGWTIAWPYARRRGCSGRLQVSAGGVRPYVGKAVTTWDGRKA